MRIVTPKELSGYKILPFDLYNEADLTEYDKIYKIDNKNIMQYT